MKFDIKDFTVIQKILFKELDVTVLSDGHDSDFTEQEVKDALGALSAIGTY